MIADAFSAFLDVLSRTVSPDLPNLLCDVLTELRGDKQETEMGGEKQPPTNCDTT
jgi:hypothetical protein